MGKLTTHVLDTANGVPAGGVRGQLTHATGGILRDFITNADGRCDAPLLADHALLKGVYTLSFWTAAYFNARQTALTDPPFFDRIDINFAIADTEKHYHIPLLVSPWSFSTYRGS